MALSVREYSRVEYGTPTRPLSLDVLLDRPEGSTVTRSFVLGFEGHPSSQWYSLVAPRPIEVRLTRSSEDPEVDNVFVAISGPDRRSIEGVNGNSGAGDWIELSAGPWLIGASLQSAKTVALDLVIEIRPRRVYLVGLSTDGDEAVLAKRRRILTGHASDTNQGIALLRDSQLIGITEQVIHGYGKHSPPEELPIRLIGNTSHSSSAVLSAYPVVWVDGRGRILEGGDTADPLNDNRTIYRGEGIVYTSRLRTLSGDPILLPGYSGSLGLYDHRRLLTYGVFDLSLPYLANGWMVATIPGAVTATLPDEVWMDIELVASNGRSSYPLQGFWTVLEGYSR